MAIIAILILMVAIVIMSIVAIKLALPDSRIRLIFPSTAKVYDLKGDDDIKTIKHRKDIAKKEPTVEQPSSYIIANEVDPNSPLAIVSDVTIEPYEEQPAENSDI